MSATRTSGCGAEPIYHQKLQCDFQCQPLRHLLFPVGDPQPLSVRTDCIIITDGCDWQFLDFIRTKSGSPDITKHCVQGLDSSCSLKLGTYFRSLLCQRRQDGKPNVKIKGSKSSLTSASSLTRILGMSLGAHEFLCVAAACVCKILLCDAPEGRTRDATWQLSFLDLCASPPGRRHRSHSAVLAHRERALSRAPSLRCETKLNGELFWRVHLWQALLRSCVALCNKILNGTLFWKVHLGQQSCARENTRKMFQHFHAYISECK